MVVNGRCLGPSRWSSDTALAKSRRRVTRLQPLNHSRWFFNRFASGRPLCTAMVNAIERIVPGGQRRKAEVWVVLPAQVGFSRITLASRDVRGTHAANRRNSVL